MRNVLIGLGFLLVFGLAAAPEPAGRFERLDRNGDGKITRDELPEPLRKNFDRVDRNGDGQISREEDAAIGQRRQRATAQRQQGPQLPDTIAVTRDVAYAGTENPKQALDLFVPKVRNAAKLPVLVFVHGGGWRKGDKSSGWRRLLPYLQTGNYAAASVGYRLSDEAIWPAQIHDCKAAIRWLRANADKHGLDADRIAVWGSSAGGHLVAMLGTSAGVAAMDGQLGPHADVSSQVAGVVDFYGPTDLLQMNKTAITGAKMDHDAPDSPESILLGGPLQENPDRAKTANPITYVDKQDPPMLLVHGTRDPLVSPKQSELLHEAYKAAGAKSTLVLVEGAGHGQGFGPEVTATVTRFLEHHLLGKHTEWQDQTVPAANRN